MKEFFELIELRWGAYPRRIVQNVLSKNGRLNIYIRRPKGLPKSEVIEPISPTRGRFKEEFIEDLKSIAQQLGVEIKIL